MIMCLRCGLLPDACVCTPNTPEPPPQFSTGTQVWPFILDNFAFDKAIEQDIKERHSIGTKKYGRPLTANDGRDSLRDAYQEALDLLVYLTKERLEHGGTEANYELEVKIDVVRGLVVWLGHRVRAPWRRKPK